MWVSINQYYKCYKGADFIFKTYNFVSQQTGISRRNMNTDQYLYTTFYASIATSKDKTFDFVDGKSIKYCTVDNGMSDVQVKTRHFLPFEKQYINPKSTAPYLVKLKVDLDSITSFSLLKESLQRNLGTTVDCWYENMAYLNTDKNVIKQLQTFANDGEQQLVFIIAVRHIIFHAGQNPCVKYLFASGGQSSKTQTSIGG